MNRYSGKGKDMKNAQKETAMAKQASEIGVGPKIFHSGVVQKSNLCYEFFVMERLTGPTLDEVYPYLKNDIENLMILLYKFVKHTHFILTDIHPGNVMLDMSKNQRRLYLIDFAGFEPVNENKSLFENIESVSQSVFGHFLQDFQTEDDADSIMNVTEGMLAFFKHYFPNEETFCFLEYKFLA